MSEHTELPWRDAGEHTLTGYGDINHVLLGVDDKTVGSLYANCFDAAHMRQLPSVDEARANAALIVRAVNSLASNEAKIDAMEQELEALRKVGWCAQALLSADEIKHPTLSRADAVAEADKRLRQQLGKWQMEFCASKAALSSHTEQEGGERG